MNFRIIIEEAFKKREALFHRADLNCFRLFNTDGDGIRGLTVDLYGTYLLIQFFSDWDDETAESLTGSVIETARSFPINIRGALLKDRKKKGRDPDISDLRRSRLVYGNPPPEEYYVLENGVKVAVDLISGQSTGIFPDMRELREKLSSFYQTIETETFLNLFCYTSVFSVHALMRGFKSSLNVDLSKAVLRKARENYLLNGFPCDDRDFIHGDALEWIKILNKKGRRFSFIVFDPPTFSRNKKNIFSVGRDYASALKKLSSLSRGGYVLTSVNSFSVSQGEYVKFHPPNWDLVMLSGESSDFINTGQGYLKAGVWKTPGN